MKYIAFLFSISLLFATGCQEKENEPVELEEMVLLEDHQGKTIAEKEVSLDKGLR